MKTGKKLLARGNAKLNKSIFNWSISPIKSCLNCEDCKGTCYAMNAYRRWPNVKRAWDRNLDMASTGSFVGPVVSQLARARTCKYVRIHTSGDFFSQEYIEDWARIALQFPVLQFYTYTKVSHLFNFSHLENLPNVNIVQSIADDGGINYGDDTRLKELEKMGYTCCPVTLGKKGAKCGLNCTICMCYPKVAFKIHR